MNERWHDIPGYDGVYQVPARVFGSARPRT